jgi:hypothetical protein
MASITLKVKGNDETVNFPWFNQSLDNLLGNPRPSTLQDIEKNEYWANLFHDYCHDKGAGPQFDAWANAANKDGPEREALKKMRVQSATKGIMEIREAFRADLGFVKAVVREKQKQDQGLGEELNNTFDLNWEG